MSEEFQHLLLPGRDLMSIANHFFARRDYDIAIPLYHRLIQEDPSDFAAYDDLGNIYLQKGQTILAEILLTQALALARTTNDLDPRSIDDEVIDDIESNINRAQEVNRSLNFSRLTIAPQQRQHAGRVKGRYPRSSQRRTK